MCIRGNENTKTQLKQFVLQTDGEGIHTFHLTEQQTTAIAKSSLPAIQNKDLLDYELSPTLFQPNKTIKLGNSGKNKKCGCSENTNDLTTAKQEQSPSATIEERFCNLLMPWQPMKTCIKINQVVKSHRVRPIELESVQQNTRPGSIQLGEMLVYEVCLERLGYSLGDLLYSLPLAPCESVNIAIVDWQRQDQFVREESSQYSETLSSQLVRNRSVEEFANTTIKQLQASLNFESGAALKIGKLGTVSAGYAGGFQANYRDVSAQTSQYIVDSFEQQATATKAQNSVVIYQTNQRELETVQSRNVTNHNHCHTLTMMYYEVVENVKISSEFLGTKPVVFVKYTLYDFTADLAFCKRFILKEVLLDRELLKCFDALGCKDNAADDDTNATCLKVKRLYVTIKIGDNGTGSELKFRVKYADGTQAGYVIPRGGDNHYNQYATYTLIVDITPICIDQIQSVGLENNPNVFTDGAVEIESLDVKYETTTIGGQYLLFNQAVNETIPRNEESWWDIIAAEIPETEPSDNTDTALSDHCCIENLLMHLNCNKVYYSKILWLLEDKDERAIRFENYLYNGTPLIDYIINQPVAITGNWIAFEITDAPFVPAKEEDTEASIIHLPTGGIFTEGLLGVCSTCETKDDSVFWNWQESPCPCNAPPLPATTTPANNTTALNPTSYPTTSAITYQGFPDTKDWIIANLVQQAMGNPNFTNPEYLNKLADLLKELATHIPTDNTGSGGGIGG